jgi:RNA-directed DNA polymerase
MDFSNYKDAFTNEAILLEQNIQRCLDYATIIFNAVPVIYNTSHLSVLVGYKKISKAALHTKYFTATLKL